jgi:hypothetical protein
MLPLLVNLLRATASSARKLAIDHLCSLPTPRPSRAGMPAIEPKWRLVEGSILEKREPFSCLVKQAQPLYSDKSEYQPTTKQLPQRKLKPKGSVITRPPLRPFNPAQPVGSGADPSSQCRVSKWLTTSQPYSAFTNLRYILGYFWGSGPHPGETNHRAW